MQFFVLSVGVGVSALLIWKRHSFYSFRSAEQLFTTLKAPFEIHGVVHSINPQRGFVNVKQLPFPRYLLSGSRNAAMECAESEIIPLSLLAINTNKTSNMMLQSLYATLSPIPCKAKVFYSAQHINPELPITPFYGDLFLKDFSGRFGIKGSYYSLSRELVRMGVCSIDRDM
ncbi:uncharacterized protein [Blastocystis hominis]|uniref:Uncharacterized protein n=1 Tax=Blastocystis hominis TaxID=12968 RepID=D8LW65_BLAHO|nr:uncharacterized protein [Blastocystis hominis]CBK20054.2 unnamed protein product [Blastocystis hominis]|eukprot:XP_012894102.1 uncharacterized protein [Blastocystis hominis]